MEASATLRYIRMTPRKMRMVLKEIQDQNVEIALARLRFTNRRAAQVLYKVLASAVANANTRFGVTDASDLFVKEAFANAGPTLRRFLPRAMGRATRVNKRTTHVTVVVAGRE